MGVIFALVPRLALPLALFDLTGWVYCTFNALRMTLFSLNAIFLFSALIRGHLKDLTETLLSATKIAETQGEKGNRCMRKTRFAHLMGQLSFFTAEHTRIHCLEMLLNENVVSRLMFVTVAVNILVNAVVLNFLLNEKFSLEGRPSRRRHSFS